MYREWQCSMFNELKPTSRRTWNTALLLSLGIHVAVLLLLARHYSPVTVLPHEVALGTPYSSGSVIYLAPLGRERPHESAPLHVAKATAPKQEPSSRPKPVERKREEPSQTAVSAPDVTASAGSPYGVHIPGTPLTGPAVMPALPQVFPDPSVARSDLPPGVQGDVIVEVTIDEQGNVVKTAVLKGIRNDLDQKVIATVLGWRFKPATQDGVPIPSQQDVYFHFGN